MPAVTVPQAPALARIPNVELMHAGQWTISNGTFTFTADDFAAAAAATDCPAVRRPVLKLGHTDPRFDGEPAVGWVDNLAVAESGSTLVGDYAGMPGWLGQVIASAYPDRSIEGTYDFHCQLGHTHPFVITAVALLGVTAPGIGTLASLQDVAQLYGVAAAAPVSESTFIVRASAQEEPMPNPRPMQVAVSVTTDDVRRKYYEQAPWSVWIEEMELDPLTLLTVDDDSREYARIPVTIGDGDGEDAVSFGDPVRVIRQFVEAPAVAASANTRLTFASRAESRPGTSPTETTTPAATPAPGSPAPNQEGPGMDPVKLREALGLAAEASDIEVSAALAVAGLTTKVGEPTTPVTPPAPAAPAAPPAGTVLTDEAALAELHVAAALGREAHARQQREDRERAVKAAVQSGRIAPVRAAHWLTLLEADPGSADVLASLEPVLTVEGAELGTADPGSFGDDALYASLFPAESKGA